MPARLALALCVTLAACDFTPAIEIETPAFAPAVVVRAILSAGEPAVVRLSLSGDPLAAPVAPADRLPTPTPAGATVTIFRDGRPVETLAPRRQTCYAAQHSSCNTTTGRTDVERSGPYDCSAFGGTLPVEPGATYTVRATVPGLPPAEATVTVPRPATVTVTEEGGDAVTRRLRVRVRDVPGAGTRYTLAFYREFEAYTTTVCRRGGARDTLVATPFPFRFQTRFATTEPLLLADVREPMATLFLAPFTDAGFEGGEISVVIRADAAVPPTHLVLSGGLQVQVSTLSETLYDAALAAPALFGGEDPFAEPSELPGNVAGGFGLVGAVARVDVRVPRRADAGRGYGVCRGGIC